MTLKTTIESDVKAALLGGERFKADVLKNLKAAILNEEVALNQRDAGLSDELIEKLIAREVKKRHESAALYRQAQRQELAQQEEKEAEILASYLPEQVSEEDLKKAIAEIIESTGANGQAAMGQVIGAVKAKFGNAADGATVAKLVKDALL
ncbi:MAG TPA: GatB/YqeY domain-containing protein [Candidatus Saccharibacteria bacterium]|nr:GatB/YqeY domain-containing protein [Candidatus Saccharibacteria bacterium]